MKAISALLFGLLVHLCASAAFIPEGALYRPDAEPQTQRDGILLRGEKGEIDGIRYYIWEDGQAYYSRWQIFCKTDSMTDDRSCALLKDDITIVVRRGGVSALFVGDKHFPGTSVALRIDGAKAIEGPSRGWFGRDASKLVELAGKGTNLRTRYVKWPSRDWIDSQTEAAGLPEAVRMATWMVNQAK